MANEELRGRSVLLVEDEPFTRAVVARTIGLLGAHTASQAGDGAEALAMIERERPDLVMCDVEMEPLDGLGFLRALREGEEPWRKTLPVLFMTNRIDQATVDAAYPLGVEVFLLKPVTAEALRNVLLRLLPPLEPEI
ncbi:Two-component system chemotaxis response regulator CheY [uncultured Gammaproteobacteria bacterium]